MNGVHELLDGSYDIIYMGLQKFCNPSGLSEEAVKGNFDAMPLILRVDGSKLGLRYES